MVYRSHRGHINFMGKVGFVLEGHHVESNTFKKGRGPDVFSPGIAAVGWGVGGEGAAELLHLSASLLLPRSPWENSSNPLLA